MIRLLLLLLVTTCTFAQSAGKLVVSLTNASLPRFTSDHLNRPVLSWVEKGKEGPVLCFCRSDDGGRTFGPVVRVPTPAATATHTEGRPKVAFRGDGVMYVTFEVRKPTEDAPRAGDIVYRTSPDGGKSWSDVLPLHQDNRPDLSHSFHDLTRLADGSIGVVWLDEKLPGQEGRTVKFAQTGADGRFKNEILIDTSACQCCRTSIVTDVAGGVFLAYRDLLGDGSRDMSYAASQDGGRTFSAPRLIGSDHWTVQACPHSGPQLVAAPDGVWATWFSGVEGNAGIRLKSLQGREVDYAPAIPAMRFPQVSVLPDGRKALCWEEWVGEGPDAYRKIGLKIGRSPVVYLTGKGDIAAQPTLVATKTSLLLAYTVLKGEASEVKVIELPYTGQ